MHELYNNTMAYAGATPWHGLGTRFDEDFLASEAIIAAGLDYTVEKVPLYRDLNNPGENNGEAFARVNAYATVRTDTQETLGIVGDRYEPLQNKDAFGFFDNLIVDGEARYHTAGALGVGERIWLLAKTPTMFEVVPGDYVESFLLLSNSHDGSGAVEVRLTPIRVVCANTLAEAKRDSHKIVSLRHTVGIDERVAIAGRILREHVARITETAEAFKSLAKLKVDDQMTWEYTQAIFGRQPDKKENPRAFTMWERKVAEFDLNLDRGMGVDIPGVAGTGWHLYNAAVEYADYQAKVRNATDRTESLLFGNLNAFKENALVEALALVG